MKYLMLYILLPLLLCVSSCKYFRESVKEKDEGLLKAREDSTLIADSLREVKMVLEKSVEAKTDSAGNASRVNPSDNSRFKYKIIAGSFKSVDLAKNLAGTYALKGFNAKVIPMDGTTFSLVVVEEYEDLATAQVKLSEFTRNVFPNAWLYVKK